jgi:hypothetical protein
MEIPPKSFASYSRSIFQEDTSLLILSWLERSGEVKESDLADCIGKEDHQVKRCLIDLHENRFVSYRESTVRITEFGKEVLDRLGIAEKVVESALEMLHIPSKHRENIGFLLNQYRDSAYDHYLDTQASVISYNHLHHACHFSIAETKPSKEFQTIANLAIVFRDLRNWMRHSTAGLQSRHSLYHSSGTIGELKFLSEPALHVETKSHATIRRSLDLLIWCEDPRRTIEDTLNELEKPTRTAFDKIFLIFDDFQRRSKRETWFNQWAHSLGQIDQAQKSSKLSTFYIFLLRGASIGEKMTEKAGEWDGWWAKMPPSYLKPLIVNHSSAALSHILTARSLKEFCGDTDLEPEAALMLLKRIGSKIHNLMNDES